MIALVRGEVVVDVAGVGYRLAVSSETLEHVPAAGKPVTLHSHLIVRDDAGHEHAVAVGDVVHLRVSG